MRLPRLEKDPTRPDESTFLGIALTALAFFESCEERDVPLDLAVTQTEWIYADLDRLSDVGRRRFLAFVRERTTVAVDDPVRRRETAACREVLTELEDRWALK